jgi:Fic family protein
VSRRAKEIARLWNELEAELARRGLAERAIYALYDAAIGLRVRSARYRAAAAISNQVATRDLRTLVQQGLLVPKGEKKGRIYLRGPVLKEIFDRTREPRASAAEAFGDQLSLFL